MGGIDGHQAIIIIVRLPKVRLEGVVCVLTAISFITLICTIGHTIACQITGNTRQIITLKLIRAAGFISAISQVLIIATGTIILPVTQPIEIDACDPVTAHVLQTQTRMHRMCSIRAILTDIEETTIKGFESQQSRNKVHFI